MKKSSKILGSVALSAALVMGTAAPAFAAPNAENAFGGQDGNSYAVDGTDAVIKQDKNGQSDSGASTIVTVSTYTSQLNVTVPLYLPVWLDTAGGVGVAPANYKITNGSPIEITVDRAEYTLEHGKLAFASNLTGVTNKFNIDIAPQAGASGNTFKMNGASAVAGQAKKFAQGDLDWVLGKKDAANATMNFDVTATSSPLSDRLSDETLASIVYTVKAGDASKTPHEGNGVGGTTETTFNLADSIDVTMNKAAIVNAMKAVFTSFDFDNNNVTVYAGTDASSLSQIGSSALNALTPAAAAITSVEVTDDAGSALTTVEAVNAHNGNLKVNIIYTA